MPDSFILSLPANAQRQLKLCGITTDDQLAAGLAETIYQELQTAKKFFPDEKIELTEQEISGFILNAKKLHKLPDDSKPIIEKYVSSEVCYNIPAVVQEDEFFSEDLSEEKKNNFREHLKSAYREKRAKKAISSGHPLTILLGAFSTLLVPLFLVSLIGIPALLLLSDFRPLGDSQIAYAALVIVLILPHLIMVRLVHCSVCHMNIFTFRNYPHHSKAHSLPLLGVSITTALRILFCWNFTCPACGTEQKLIGRRKNRYTRRK